MMPPRKKILVLYGALIVAAFLLVRPAYALELNCGDGIDNDTDMSSLNDGVTGLPKLNGVADGNPLTGVDCLDYDCRNSVNCPLSERSRYNVLTHETVADDRACFDGLDNDMNGKIDCAEPTCAGVISPDDPSKICRALEFDVANKYQYCANGFDDNGDGQLDCNDASCYQVFGNCGPCPQREDINYSACADTKDNNYEGNVDCKDPTCYSGSSGYRRLGRLGSTSFPFTSPAYCAAAENTDAYCHDGFDNDANGYADCGDPACASFCPPEDSAHPALCGDYRDNDANTLIDCADPKCFNVGSCMKNWTNATSCMPFPQWNPSTGFQAISVTMDARSYKVTHVGSSDAVEIRGSGNYESVTVLIGDNTNAAAYYPYASASLCTLSGTNAGMFSLSAVNNQILEVYSNEPDQTIAGFDVTVTCSIPPATVPVPTPRVYPISVAAARAGTAEVGENNAFFSTTLYEATPPSIMAVEAEGWNSGTSILTIAYGERRSLRIVPNNDPSYICRCTASISGITLAPNLLDATGDCVTEKVMFPVTGTYDIQNLAAEDGVGNLGAPTNRPLSVVVTPSVTRRLALIADSPQMSATFFKDGAMKAIVSTGFTTGATNGFSSTTNCDVLLYNGAGTLINVDAGAATASAANPMPNPKWNPLDCSGEITLPSEADGEYFLSVRVTDAAGYVGESNRVPVYICNNVPANGEPENVCSKADFDGDGAVEGMYSNIYSGPSGTPQVCDNCVAVSNPLQLDDNANGIGNDCEMGKTEFGRCEVDRDVVCLRDSLGAPGSANPCGTPGDPMCCPAPTSAPVTCSVGNTDAVNGSNFPITAQNCPFTDGRCCPSYSYPPTDRQLALAQKCITEDTGLCTVGSSVCFSDWECHYCTGSDTKGCRTDADCGPIKCTGHGNAVCQTDADCTSPDTCTLLTAACETEGSSGAGTCSVDGYYCRRDTDCDQSADPQTCDQPGARKINLCESSLLPWLQTKYGSAFSTRGFFAPENAPQNQFNATFCLTSKGDITDFTSEFCSAFSGKDENIRYSQPNVNNSFKTVVGGIDVPGMLSGRYGPVVTATTASQVQALLGQPLGGQVIKFIPSEEEPDLVIANPVTMPNGNGTISGNGTVLVMGGDLYFNSNVTYVAGQSISRVDDLASVAWVVLADATNDMLNYCLATNRCSQNTAKSCATDDDCKKGNIYIGGLVTAIDGAFFSDGSEGISTTSTKLGQSLTGKQLTVNGLMIAHKISLKRTYRRASRGSELIYYDGRALLNPPPGIIDVARSLPTFGY